MERTVTPSTGLALLVVLGGGLLVTLTVALLLTAVRSGTTLGLVVLATLFALGGLMRSAANAERKVR